MPWFLTIFGPLREPAWRNSLATAKANTPFALMISGVFGTGIRPSEKLTFARPMHPGEYLREEYLVPLGLSAPRLAKMLGLPRTRIERIVKEQIGITPDTALRLARLFKTTPQFWMNFQVAY